MSPGLHKWVYGYHQHSFAQTKRFGGFRPMVFMQHGLAVGMFMCMAALAAFALWLGRSVRGIAGMPMTWIFAALGATAVLCKSLGAIVLMFIGMLIVLAVKHQKSAAVLVLVLGLPLAYMGARTVGGWDGEELIELVGGEDGTHGHSIQFRVNSEKGVWALVQPNLLLGRARFSYRLDGTEFSNNQRIVGDSLWIGALGKYGLVGLCSLTAAFMVPPLLLIRRWHAATWSHPTLAPAAVLAIVITLSLFDNLFNAMLNPLFVVMMGALSGCCGDRSSAYVSAGSRFVPATVQPG
jgi:O-antigen ligase